MGAPMLYAILICSDGDCEATYEAWAEPDQLEDLTCELCGCTLQAVAFSEAPEGTRSGRRPPDLQLRDAA
jgi:hypothetical protein